MNKKMLALALAMAFTASTAAFSFASSYVKCEVKSVDGATVTLDCGKGAKKFNVGTTIKVKPAKKSSGPAIEGC